MSLISISKSLSKQGIKHVVVSMAVRSYKQEGPIIKDVHTIAQAIKRSLKNVPANYKSTYGSRRRDKPVYTRSLSELGVPDELIRKYSDLNVSIEPGDSAALGWYSAATSTLRITYSPGMVDSSTIDFFTAMRGLDIVIEHEVRHFVDHVSGLHTKAMADRTQSDNSYSEYYNREFELDARLTSLFVKIDTLFRGSSLMALQGKVDSMSKEHHNLLKDDFFVFLRWIKLQDTKLTVEAMIPNILTPAMMKEAEGKCEQFWLFLREEYGMALRVFKSTEITPAMKKAWTTLLNSGKDKAEHAKQLAKIAGN